MSLLAKPKAAAPEGITAINVTPLVDVCLVLVIIFMVLAPFAMQAGIEVAGSKVGAAKGEAAIARNVTVVLDDKGHLTVNGQKATWDTLGNAIAAGLERSHDRLVSVDATPKAQVGKIVDILDTAKQRGAKRVALLNR